MRAGGRRPGGRCRREEGARGLWRSSPGRPVDRGVEPALAREAAAGRQERRAASAAVAPEQAAESRGVAAGRGPPHVVAAATVSVAPGRAAHQMTSEEGPGRAGRVPGRDAPDTAAHGRVRDCGDGGREGAEAASGRSSRAVSSICQAAPARRSRTAGNPPVETGRRGTAAMPRTRQSARAQRHRERRGGVRGSGRRRRCRSPFRRETGGASGRMHRRSFRRGARRAAPRPPRRPCTRSRRARSRRGRAGRAYASGVPRRSEQRGRPGGARAPWRGRSAGEQVDATSSSRRTHPWQQKVRGEPSDRAGVFGESTTPPRFFPTREPTGRIGERRPSDAARHEADEQNCTTKNTISRRPARCEAR
jgi:hypothetical protein